MIRSSIRPCSRNDASPPTIGSPLGAFFPNGLIRRDERFFDRDRLFADREGNVVAGSTRDASRRRGHGGSGRNCVIRGRGLVRIELVRRRHGGTRGHCGFSFQIPTYRIHPRNTAWQAKMTDLHRLVTKNASPISPRWGWHFSSARTAIRQKQRFAIGRFGSFTSCRALDPVQSLG